MASMVQELAAHPELVYRHTVAQYHEMISNGSIMEGEPFELLDGQIVRKIRSMSREDLTTVGIEHALIVKRLAKLSALYEPLNCYVQSQQPITIPPRDEPEPDAAIVRGALDDYADHHPFVEDVLCVFEVSDSSLARDRGYKLQLYANAEIPMYVIVNLINRVVEVYQQPLAGSGSYAEVEYCTTGQSFALPTSSDKSVILAVAQLFSK